MVELAKLDGFVRYQRQLAPLYAQLAREIDALARGGDGGESLEAMGLTPEVLARRAEQEQRVRAECGLAERDVLELGAITREIISRRSVARALAAGDELAQLSRIDATRLPPDQQAALKKTLAELKAKQEAAADLSAQRERFGGANVDRVLTRENELIESWEQTMKAWGQR